MKIQHLLTTLATTALFITPSLTAPHLEVRDAEKLALQERDPSIPGRLPARPPSRIKQSPKKDTKYFHEPGASDVLGHYDIRYYKGSPVPYEEHHEILVHLIRAYLLTFRENNIETWIAHGTLLGWWWNGKIMPWDADLDVQVSASTLTWLGQNMNMTMHNYTSVDSNGETSIRQYLLDINPNHVERVRGDGQNVIDARFIDISNGMFVDITGLSETNPAVQPGVWSCKNFHRYRTRDLYPMRETVFEGVPASVPYSFDKILTDEYTQRALTRTTYQGYVLSNLPSSFVILFRTASAKTESCTNIPTKGIVGYQNKSNGSKRPKRRYLAQDRRKIHVVMSTLLRRLPEISSLTFQVVFPERSPILGYGT